MRAHRTRMLAAVLGTAILVTGVAPAAVFAAKPADHGNPHATAPAPDPSADPTVDPVEPTPVPVVEPTAEPTEVPAVTPDPTEVPAVTPDPTQAPVKSNTPDAERGTPDGGTAQPEVAPDVVDLETTLTLAVTPVTFDAGDSITITATVSPIPSCGTIDITYNGSTTSGLVPDVAGQAAVTTTAAAGLKSIDATYSGCAGFLTSSGSTLTDTRTTPDISLEADRSTAIQYEQPVTLTAHFLVGDATGTVTFWRDVGPHAAVPWHGDRERRNRDARQGQPAGGHLRNLRHVRRRLPVPAVQPQQRVRGHHHRRHVGEDQQPRRPVLAVLPKNDGYRDTDKISGKTLEPATVTIRIYTSGGTRIKTFSLGTKNGTYSATWTGRRSKDGSLFPQGTYTVKQSFKDGRGNTKTVNQSIALSSRSCTGTRPRRAATPTRGRSRTTVTAGRSTPTRGRTASSSSAARAATQRRATRSPCPARRSTRPSARRCTARA